MPKEDNPLISVIMPAYNAEKYLREAIESVLHQTYSNFEFIIINDGSIDHTKDIILSYDDPRIIYVENQKNSGICVTLNKGLDIARGKYIVRMDSDDISLPNRFKTQVDFMECHPDVGVAGCLVETFNSDTGESNRPTSEFDYYECRASLLFSPCLAHPAAIIRTAIIRKYNLEYDDYFRGMEDYHLWWKISLHSFITNIPSILLKYRIHKSQVTQIPLTQNFILRHKEFIRQRLEDIGVECITPADVEAISQYSLDPKSFDDKDLETFILTLKKVLKTIKSNKKYHLAQKLVVARAISYAHDLSSDKIHKSNLHYMYKAYFEGCMPLSWFTKRLYHIILTN